MGDETYELAVAFAHRRSLKTVPWVVIYDFFGLDAMSRNPFERLSVYILNRLRGGGPHGKRPPFDLTLFVGEAEDIADRPLGPQLPNGTSATIANGLSLNGAPPSSSTT